MPVYGHGLTQESITVPEEIPLLVLAGCTSTCRYDTHGFIGQVFDGALQVFDGASNSIALRYSGPRLNRTGN